MSVFGSSVLTWTRRAVTGAADAGSRLWAHAAAVSCGDGRLTEQRREQVTGGRVSSGTLQPPIAALPRVTTRAPDVPARSEAQGPRPAPVPRVVPAPVTPTMVRRWAHEQGIAVADRGRIPRSVMERYVAEVASRSDRTDGRSPKRRRSASRGSPAA